MVSARIGALIVHLASARGVDGRRLITDAGIEPGLLTDAQARIPLDVEVRLWDRAAELSGDPLFGLNAAAAIRPGAFDVLDYAVRTAPDLRTALHRLARYNRLVHDLAGFKVIETGNAVRIEHQFADAIVQPCRHAAEFTLASLVVVASQLCGEEVRARDVEFAHPIAGKIETYRSIFGVSPRFEGAKSCLILAREILDRKVVAADPALSRIITAHAEQLLTSLKPIDKGIAATVRRHLAENMSNGPITLNAISRSLHLSTRSLQRRLHDEGTSFANVVDELRCELAIRYVSDSRFALGEVAYLLGFAEPSAFHRAFKRWTGTTPAAARRSSSRKTSCQ